MSGRRINIAEGQHWTHRCGQIVIIHIYNEYTFTMAEFNELHDSTGLRWRKDCMFAVDLERYLRNSGATMQVNPNKIWKELNET